METPKKAQSIYPQIIAHRILDEMLLPITHVQILPAHNLSSPSSQISGLLGCRISATPGPIARCDPNGTEGPSSAISILSVLKQTPLRSWKLALTTQVYLFPTQ